MRVANHAAIPQLPIKSALGKTHESEVESDFASAVGKLSEEQKTAAKKTAAASSYNYHGATWTDQTIATLIGGISAPIDTTKTINWASKGNKELTEQQIAKLKEKYDVRNMSHQEYYDLLSDLTHMEVLSAEDMSGLFLAKAGSGFTPGPSRSEGRTPGFQVGDMILKHSADLERFLLDWDWLNSPEYDIANPSSMAKQEYAQGLRKDISEVERILAILKQLEQ